MDDNLTGLLITATCVLGPVWLVMHYKYKYRGAGRLSDNEAASLAQMTDVAQRLEQRVATLERILDAEVPAWRSNTFNTGRPSPDGFYDRKAG